MQIKMTDILNLNSIYTKIKNKSFSVKTTYRMSKIFSVVTKEAEYYSNELNELIGKYADRDENGGFIPAGKDGVQIKKEYIDTVQSRLNDLLNLEVDVPDVQFSIEDLESGNLTVDEFNILMPFIKDED